jgi:hypothetical protein
MLNVVKNPFMLSVVAPIIQLREKLENCNVNDSHFPPKPYICEEGLEPALRSPI